MFLPKVRTKFNHHLKVRLLREIKIEYPLNVLMLILNINQLPTLMQLLLTLIVTDSDGKLIHVSYLKLMLTTLHIVMMTSVLLRQVHQETNQRVLPKKKQKLKPKPKHLEKKLRASKMLCKRLESGQSNTRLPMTSQMIKFLNRMTSEISMDITSLGLSETKDLVDHATLYLLLRW